MARWRSIFTRNLLLARPEYSPRAQPSHHGHSAVTIANTARQTSEMHASTISERDAHTASELWPDANARGLALAAVGAWTEAVDAWTLAVDEIAAAEDTGSLDALALLLNNLAHASFRAGRVDDGIRHAQRTCALRAALLGDDAIAVARARADLAVMLGAAGRADEGLVVIARAIAGVELAAGDDDHLLLTLIENAARLAMAAGQPSTAEPHLIRLHALFAAHDESTHPADVLLARLTEYRGSHTTIHEVEVLDEGLAEGDESAENTLPSSIALGFRVEYGTPIERELQRGEIQVEAPPTSTHIPTPNASVPVITTPMPALSTRATPSLSAPTEPGAPAREPRVLRRPRLRFG